MIEVFRVSLCVLLTYLFRSFINLIHLSDIKSQNLKVKMQHRTIIQEVDTTFRSSHGHAFERKGHLAVATANNNVCRIAHDFLIYKRAYTTFRNHERMRAIIAMLC
jgi:hypothetical protein